MKHLLCLSTLSIITMCASLTWAKAPEEPKHKDGVLFFGQLFTDYQYQSTETESFNDFQLRRAEIGLGYAHKKTRFVVNTEAIRSAGPQSLFGIDNNSLVFRVKHAFAQWTPLKPPAWISSNSDRRFWSLDFRVGMIPDVWVAQVEQSYDLRGINTTLSEGGNFFDTSDLGISASVGAFHKALTLNMSITNGEGRNERELNSGKNATFVFSIRPNQFLINENQYLKHADLGIHLSYRDGSVGFASLANHRIAGAITARFNRIFAGFEYIHATGYNIPDPDTGVVDARGFGGWLNGAIYPNWLGLALTYRQVQPNTEIDGNWNELIAGIYVDAIDTQPNRLRDVLGFPRLRLYLSYRRLGFDSNVSPTPGNAQASTVNAIMLTLSARDAKQLLVD